MKNIIDFKEDHVPKDFTAWLQSTVLSTAIQKKLLDSSFAFDEFSDEEILQIKEVFKDMPQDLAFLKQSPAFLKKINLFFGRLFGTIGIIGPVIF